MPNLPAPGGTDVWGADLNAAIESLHLGPDTHANRPTTGLVEGTLYACTTHGTLERWDGAAWGAYAANPAGSGETTGADTSIIGSSNTVALNATLQVDGTTTITPTVDSMLLLKATVVTNNTGGTQGAYLTPYLKYTWNGQTDFYAAVAAWDNQIIKNPQSNTLLKNIGMFFLEAGVTYTVGYRYKVGSASPSVTFTQPQSTWSMIPWRGQTATGVDPNETWKDYTPVLTATTTNPTMGTGAIALGRYSHVGNTVKVRGYFKMGSGGSVGSGGYRISLPKPIKDAATLPSSVGTVFTYDAVAGTGINTWTAVADVVSASRVKIFRPHTTSFEAGASIPAASWLGAGSEFGFEFEYETDEYNPVVIPVNGSTSGLYRATLSSAFVSSDASGSWSAVTGLGFAVTPVADGYLDLNLNAKVLLSSASGIYARIKITPSPVTGLATKPSGNDAVAAGTNAYIGVSSRVEVKAGVTYTVQVEQVHYAGNATFSADDYTALEGNFTPKAVGIASSDQAPQLLAQKVHNPTAMESYSTTSTSDVDVDASDLQVSFVAPASGNVTMVLSAMAGQSTSAAVAMRWMLRDASGTVAGTKYDVFSSQNGRGVQTLRIPLSGLTPGTTYTYKWGWNVEATMTGVMYAGGVIGPAIMEVWDAQPVPVSGVILWRTVGAAGEPTLQGTWVNYGAPYTGPQFRRVGDEVQLRGLVKSGASGSLIFTLPVGFRPAYQMITNGNSLLIYADGSVINNGGTLSAFSLEGARFSVLA